MTATKRAPFDTAVMYELHLRGGNGDIACGRCLSDAKRDSGGSAGIVSVAQIDDPNAPCQWCGILQDEPYEVLGWPETPSIRSEL